VLIYAVENRTGHIHYPRTLPSLVARLGQPSSPSASRMREGGPLPLPSEQSLIEESLAPLGCKLAGMWPSEAWGGHASDAVALARRVVFSET